MTTKTIYLLLSIFLVAIAPFLYFSTFTFRPALKKLEKVVGFVVCGLVVFHLLPESFETAGVWAIVMAVLGFFLPTTLEKIWFKRAHDIHLLSILVGVVGIALHSFMDGAGLSMGSGCCHHGHHNHLEHSLPLAIIFHRLPAGLLMCHMSHTLKKSIFVISVICLFTVVGFFFGEYVPQLSEDTFGVALFQALVAGSLLHTVHHS